MRTSRSGWIVALALLAAGLAACSSGTGKPVSARPRATRGSMAANRRPSRKSAALPAGELRTLHVPVGDRGPGGTRDVIVYTPRVRHPEKLPVLYWLTGSGGVPSAMCNTTAARNLDAAFRNGIKPFVLACPSAAQHRQKDSEWADSLTGPDRFETFVTDWARKAVEGGHPRPADMRAIGGFSMGGFASAAMGLRHPGLYRQVVSLAGYYKLDDPDHVFGTTAATRDPHTPNLIVDRARGQRWFLEECSGDHDPLTGRSAGAFAPKLRAARAATVQLTRRPGMHNYPWAVAQLPLIARFLSAGWA